MAVIIPQVVSEDKASGAQVVESSLRFNTAYKTYLTRTPASSGNQKTWTWSCWIKRQAPGNGADQYFFQGRANASYYTYFLFDSNDKIRLYASRGGASSFDLITSAVFRDTGSWYHIVIAMDNTQGTASDRMKIYVNGVEETDFATSTYPSQNVDYYLNDQYPMQVSGIDGATVTEGNYSQMYLIDGQMLDASYFGYTDELTNTWRPKKFNIEDAPTADWGTCGSYLPFDGSAPIGEDQSGKGNHWTPKNFVGSAKISKATGALPILETMSGGNVALGNRARGNAGIAVTVYNPTGSQNRYYFDGVEAPTLNFARGQTVTFDTSDSTVATHPLRFSITSNNSGGSEYTDGRVTGASEGSAGAATTITFPTSAPDTLYYYCTAHSGMGGALGLRSDVQVADPYAWKNTLALPGFAHTDVSPSVNCTTADKALTFNGNMTGTVNAGLATDHYNFYGKSFYFDGSGDYINVASSADCTNMGTGDFTFEAWVNLTNTSNRGTWFDTRASGGTTGLTFGHETDGSVRVYMNASSGGDITVQQSTPCIVNKWYHMAVTRESNTVRLFIDGRNVSSGTRDSDLNNTNAMNIGYKHYTSSSFNYFTGWMNDARIYKGFAKYTSNFIPASTNPNIQLDSPSGVAYESQLATTTNGSVGFKGVAPSGSGNKLIWADYSDFDMGTGDWTQEFWVYPLRQGNGERQNMVGNLTAWGANYFITQISHPSYPGLVCVWWYNENDSAPVATSREPIPERVWTHIAVVRNGNNIKIFVNGKDDTTVITSSPSGSIDMSLSGMELGRHTSTNTYLNGYVSNLRIVKGTAVYTENFIPSKEPLTNVSGTVLLCCQDQTSATNYAVSPQPYGTITTGGDPTASSTAPTGSSGSVDFDGNDKLTLASNSDFAFGEGPYTVEFWMYSDTVDQSCVIYNVGTGNGFVINRGSTIGINQYNVGNKVHTSDITDQAWVHYAFVREGTGTNGTKIYKDGTLDTTGTDATNWTVTHESAIGGNVANTQYFDGKISNFRIVKGKAVYTSNFTAPTRDLTAIDGTVLLCCQSATDETAAADIPSAITQSNDTKAFTFNPFDRNDDFVEGTESGYCVLNYLDNQAGTITGLAYTCSGEANVSGTVAMPSNSGKFYWEIQADKDGGGVLGIGALSCSQITGLSDMNKIFGYSPNGSKYENSTQTSYGETYRNGDMVSVLFDTDLKKLEFWKNGVSQGLAFHGSDDNTGGVFFDGSNDYLTLASSADFVMRGNFTMECWFYPKDTSGVQVIINGRGLASSGGPVIYINGTNLIFDHGGGSVVTASSAVSAGTWYHVAGTREGTTWTLYKNGASVGSATNTTQYTSNTAFAIANSWNSEYFCGMVSNVRVVAACVYTSAFDVPTKELENIPHTKLLCCQSRTSATAYTVAPGSISANSAPSPRDCKPFDDQLAMDTNLYFPQVHCNALDLQFNFGQNPYRYTPPDGYKSVCLSNISDPEIVRSDHYVGITTWSGAQTGSGQALRRIPLDFQPDFVWIKQLNQAYSTGHQLYDSVRGAGDENELDSSSDQYMGEGNPEEYGWVEKFDGVGGFTVKGGTQDYDYVDKSSVNYVAWCWKAGGNKNTFNVDGVGYASFAASPLTAGPTAGDGIGEQTNLTVTGCSVGTKQGFSIIRYNTANFSGSGNFPHGLDKAPQILITKAIVDISGAANWGFYYNMKGGYGGSNVDQNTEWVTLNQDIATGGNGTGRWVGGEDGPFAYLGRDHIWVDQGSYANANMEVGKSSIAYMWHSVPGLQKFGTYEGNGNANGPHINCGFRPALVIVRRLDTANNWQITDDTRSPFNVMNKGLYADLDNVQQSTDRVDYVSNGFKIRASLNENNASGGTYLYMAWAKTPYNNMYGGQSNAR